MINKNLTDSEIKKALECCTSDDVSKLNCTHCPNLQPNCMMVLYKLALDLINRQDEKLNCLQADLEGQKLLAQHWKAMADSAKSNSYKENANKCIHCGEIIPEGRLSCPSCEKEE